MTERFTEDTASSPRTSVLRGRGGVLVLAASALILLLIGATAGLMLARNDAPAADRPSTDSVDAGFLRDMTTHHKQAVKMAHWVQENTESADMELFAFDMEYQQTIEIGTMQGWLKLWDLSLDSLAPEMAWMSDAAHSHGHSAAADDHSEHAAGGAGGTPLMPGMATPEELQELVQARGADADRIFLQLMIRHHQGGADMMTYAIEHGQQASVRQLAQQMLNAQTKEISVMTEWLAKDYGAEPLPFDN